MVWADDSLDLLIDHDLVVVRWRHATVAAARELHPYLLRHHEQVGVPLFLAIVIGSDCPPPDLSTRDALLRGYNRVYHCCQDARMVVIGASARQLILRSVVTAMSLAANLRGQSLHVDSTIRELATAAAKALGRDVDAIIAQLIAGNMLDPTELDG